MKQKSYFSFTFTSKKPEFQKLEKEASEKTHQVKEFIPMFKISFGCLVIVYVSHWVYSFLIRQKS